jgi:hypothetical protein
MAMFQIEAVTVNGPGTGRGVDLKMETLWRISCDTVTGKFQEFCRSYRFTPFCAV